MEQSQDVGTGEITPEMFDADEAQETSPKAESSPAKEAKAEAKAETKPEAEEKVEKAETTETETEDSEEVDETETKPQTKADERKTQLNSEIRDLVSQRNALKAEVAKANAEVYQPATEAELTEQGMTALEAKVEAMRQEQEVEKYNSQVADAQLTISSEAERVLIDFPIFNPESDSYDEELANEAADLLKANLVYDPNTEQIIGSNVSTYQLYKTLARASGISATKGQIKGQQDTEKMLANADSGSSAAPASKPKDPTGLEALWGADADF